jgi:glycerol-3-phosphate acyltransferase PlsY
MTAKLFLIYALAGVTAYLLAGINPAIVLSKAIYKEDIRNNENGSGNPGFTNFKRVYGGKWAWLVMASDIGKCVLILAVFGSIFGIYAREYELDYDLRQIGIAYTALCASIGHDFPIWYGFKGGKGFLVNIAAIWFYDWRAGLVGVIILCVLLFTIKYMSVATMLAVLSAPVTLLIVGAEPWTIGISFASAALLVIRHKENIKRLMNGTERKFSFGSKKEK